jgi:hypothetical protein
MTPCGMRQQLVYLANDILFHAQRQRPDAGPAGWAADPVAVELRNALAVMVCATSAHANMQVPHPCNPGAALPFCARARLVPRAELAHSTSSVIVIIVTEAPWLLS